MSKKKDGTVWVRDNYPTDLKYASVENAVEQLQKALEAQKRGEWRGLSIETDVEDDYGSHYATLTLSGERPETEAEKVKRENLKLHLDKQNEDRQRKMYEELKKKFEPAEPLWRQLKCHCNEGIKNDYCPVHKDEQ